jgi:hypothetical protein
VGARKRARPTQRIRVGAGLEAGRQFGETFEHSYERTVNETVTGEDGVDFIEQHTVVATVTATVIVLPNDTLPRFKISDTSAAKSVYGVFAWWDHDGSNDAMIAGLGAYVIRIAAGETVRRGDLIESAGNGCGRVMRGVTCPIEMEQRRVAKVTAAVVIDRCDDGSYAVPCTLHCG